MMLRRLGILSFVLIAAFVGTLAATTDEAALEDAMANYQHHVGLLVRCLAVSGYEVEATKADNGIFYNVDVDFSAADSMESWDGSYNEYTEAIDACTSPDLLEATADVEALVRPNSEELRTIAETCASGEFGAAADAEDLLMRAASTSQGAAHCIVTAMNEYARSLVEP